MSGKTNSISSDWSSNLMDTRGMGEGNYNLSAYYMSGIAHNSSRSRYYYFSHFPGEDTEAQRSFYHLLGFWETLGQFNV